MWPSDCYYEIQLCHTLHRSVILESIAEVSLQNATSSLVGRILTAGSPRPQQFHFLEQLESLDQKIGSLNFDDSSPEGRKKCEL